MDQIAAFVIYAATAVIGWFVKVLWDADKELRDSLFKLREELPAKYIQRDDYHRDIGEIKQLLRDISSKLDGKADK